MMQHTKFHPIMTFVPEKQLIELCHLSMNTCTQIIGLSGWSVVFQVVKLVQIYIISHKLQLLTRPP